MEPTKNLIDRLIDKLTQGLSHFGIAPAEARSERANELVSLATDYLVDVNLEGLREAPAGEFVTDEQIAAHACEHIERVFG